MNSLISASGCGSEEFEFWGGDIHGTVLKVDPGLSMLQEWYGADLEAPSFVLFTLVAEADGATRVELEHTGLPDDEAASFDAGWDDYYFGPLRALLEK